ncbi:type III pantothenate kinase [Paracholeplasma manati]|uniref:type III pantothenate kinase n=1 Tax=Paracholeplasma manati TaxID=591373 RepID=UPI002407C7D8|nr:type III pantothenate kinase [Paracholeplasma manati]MDG0888209.1 type III pantothenate kinase [Paracholeplasma manati]
MILLIDVGNTEVKIGVTRGDKIEQKFRLSTDRNLSADAYYLLIHPFIKNEVVEKVAIASVVPPVTKALKELFIKYYQIQPLVVGPGIKTGINVKTDYPKEVGADLICAVAGARTEPTPVLIVDLGTATKYIYMEKATIKGVIITPGVMISMRAMVSNTALLPEFDLEVPAKVLGTNTIACMQSGVTYGVAAQVDGLIERIQTEVGQSFKVIMTGGLSEIIKPLCRTQVERDEHLVLCGLYDILLKN